MVDITKLSLTDKIEIAAYIKEDTLEYVNSQLEEITIKETFYTKYGKRILDLIVAVLAFSVCCPINFIIAIVTFFDVGNPIIFKQSRIGKGEKCFTIYKFRNMTNEKDVNGELLPPSERVTKWGKFVRKTSLDELLNFVTIIKGDMSIIGPRPLLDYYCSRLNKKHKLIYQVKPGLECPMLTSIDHTLSWQERLDHYVWYAENCNLLLDIKLFIRMFTVVFDKKEIQGRSNSSRGGLLGYNLNGDVIYTKEVPEKYINQYCQAHGYKSIEDGVRARY